MLLLSDPEPVLTMMNKEDLNKDMNLLDRNVGIEIIEATDRPDDRMPSASMASTGKLIVDPSSPDRKVKRKRRSPEKPWKKPADMPKRPLSAYNLFFKDERERLLSTGSEGKQREGDAGDVGDDAVEGRSTGKGSSKKQKKPTGIGFANLAKSIAAKWKDLEDEVRAPFEKVAAAEKKKYDELVAEWRIKQTAKKKALAAAKKDEENERRHAPSYRESTAPKLFSSEQSLGSFSDTSNPYPPEWFHSADGSERDERLPRGVVPPVVDTSPGASSDRRSYDFMASPGWHYMQDPASSHYYGHANPHHSHPPPTHGYDETESSYTRYPDTSHRASYYQGSYSPDLTHSPVPNSGYRDYYHHTQQPSYQQHHSQSHHHHLSSSAGRHSDVRVPRASSLPVSRHHTTDHSASSTSPSDMSGQPQHRRHHHSVHSSYHRSSQQQDHASSSSRYHLHGRGSSSSGASLAVYPRSASMSSSSIPRPSPPPLLPLGEILGASGGGGSSSRQRVSTSAMMMMLPHDDDDDDRGDDNSFHSVATEPTTTIPVTAATARSVVAAAVPASQQRRHLYSSDHIQDAPSLPPQPQHDDVSAVETSLQSLTESLDEDAISFITSIKYS